MRRVLFVALVLAVAVVVHVDWHLARPAHHRLSLEWQHHWLFAAAAFAAIGWIIARRWPQARARAALWVVGLGLLLGQGLEPVLELAIYRQQFGYPSDPGRWEAFALCVVAGLPALTLALWLCRPRLHSRAALTHEA